MNNEKLIKLPKQVEEMKTQMDNIEQQIPSIPNAIKKLDVLNSYGNYQNIHPKILYFENGLFGKKFWMAYTPYPNGSVRFENPHISSSDDGLNWSVGLELEPWGGSDNIYNNDTHLVYNGSQLEVWWRTADITSGKTYLKRRTTTDGVNWSATQTIGEYGANTNDRICPTLLFEDNKYKMLTISNFNSKWTLFYSESVNGTTWTTPTQCLTDLGQYQPWHMDIIKDGNKYIMVTTAYNSSLGETNNTADLYYLESLDLINWNNSRCIIPKSKVKSFDDGGLYRSSVVKVDGYYYVYYSALNKTGQRSLAISYGKTITSLVGYNGSDFSEVFIGSGLNSATLTPRRDIASTLEFLQNGKSDRYCHIKIGQLKFGDRVENSTTSTKDSIGFSSVFDTFQRYDGTQWIGINTKLYCKLTNEISINNTLTDIIYNNISVNNTKYNNGVYTPAGIELLKLTLTLTVTNVTSFSEFEIQLVDLNNNLICSVCREKLTSTTQLINKVVAINVSVPFKIVAKYIGAEQIKTTRYATQNTLLIENF